MDEVLATTIDEYGDLLRVVRIDTRQRQAFLTIHDPSKSDDGAAVYVSDALSLIDSAGLNTTANELRAKLEEVNATALRIAHESVAKNERIIELEQAIASLRQRDTVRPAVDTAEFYSGTPVDTSKPRTGEP